MDRVVYIGNRFHAVTENGILVEYLQTDIDHNCGDILIGRVGRIMPGLGCAFVDIGRKLSGFLPLDGENMTFSGTNIRSGMYLPFQIRKEERDGKGAFLSCDLTFPGKSVILMPMNRYIGVSSRIREEKDREVLKKIGKEIADNSFGLVMRSSSLHADQKEIRLEVQELYKMWSEVRQAAKISGKAGTVLFHQDTAAQLISDYEAKGIDRIVKTEALSHELNNQLQISKKRIIHTENGGNIVIDRCEAMTVIDVNTAASCPDSTKEATFLDMNLSACEKIVSQIRLRNLAGIILIDFIDMNQEESRKKVAERLEELLQNDRRKTVLHGWTNLGLMEMTRKRMES